MLVTGTVLVGAGVDVEVAGTVLVGAGVDVEVAGTVVEGAGVEVAAAPASTHNAFSSSPWYATGPGAVARSSDG